MNIQESLPLLQTLMKSVSRGNYNIAVGLVNEHDSLRPAEKQILLQCAQVTLNLKDVARLVLVMIGEAEAHNLLTEEGENAHEAEKELSQ